MLNWQGVGGIIGKLSYERDEALAHPALEQMLEAVWHPGADSQGLHTASGVALGWRGDGLTNGHRLAVRLGAEDHTPSVDALARTA